MREEKEKVEGIEEEMDQEIMRGKKQLEGRQRRAVLKKGGEVEYEG